MKIEKIEISNKDYNLKIPNLVKHSQILLQVISDITSIILSYFTYYIFRFELGFFSSNIKPGLTEFTLGVFIFLIFWLILFFLAGLYKNWYERSPFDEMWAVIKVTLIGCFILFFAVSIDSQSSPRKLFLIYAVLISFYSILGRTIVRNIEKNLRRKRKVIIPVLIVGTTKEVINFYEKTEISKSWGFKAYGLILLDKNEDLLIDFRIKNKEIFIGDFTSFENVIEQNKLEAIIIASEETNHNLLLKIVNIASENNLRVKIETDLYEIFTGQAKTLNLYGIPLIEISTQLLKPWEQVIKRSFDIFFSFLVLLLGLPFWILIALIIKLDSKGPIFYTQLRVGKDGAIFKIYKFRSMFNEKKQSKEQWTIVNDPRVTKFGKFIRKTHLDEIPQFWNVLIGDMSVVGPRPEQPNFVEEFTKQLPHYKRRLKVRPGITGLWQINSRAYILDIEQIHIRLKDDFYYIENMSIKLDIEIVIRTVWCVVIGHGQT